MSELKELIAEQNRLSSHVDQLQYEIKHASNIATKNEKRSQLVHVLNKLENIQGELKRRQIEMERSQIIEEICQRHAFVSVKVTAGGLSTLSTLANLKLNKDGTLSGTLPCRHKPRFNVKNLSIEALRGLVNQSTVNIVTPIVCAQKHGARRQGAGYNLVITYDRQQALMHIRKQHKRPTPIEKARKLFDLFRGH